MVEVVYVSWSRALRLCYRLAKMVADSGYRPEVIVAVMRGGVVPALVISDVLNVESFYAIRVKHWGIAEEVHPTPVVEQLPQGRVEGRRVLLVDEVADTGKTLEVAIRELSKLNPRELRSAVLHLKPTSTVVPDYYAERLDRWIWVFYPWSLAETLIALTLREYGSGGLTEEQLLKRTSGLAKRLGVGGPVERILRISLRYYHRSQSSDPGVSSAGAR